MPFLHQRRCWLHAGVAEDRGGFGVAVLRWKRRTNGRPNAQQGPSAKTTEFCNTIGAKRTRLGVEIGADDPNAAFEQIKCTIRRSIRIAYSRRERNCQGGLSALMATPAAVRWLSIGMAVIITAYGDGNSQLFAPPAARTSKQRPRRECGDLARVCRNGLALYFPERLINNLVQSC
jgi:hypothetical protein